jgi:hypothetical protein
MWWDYMAVKKAFKNHPVNLIIAALFILAFIAFEFWDHYIPETSEFLSLSIYP